MACHAIRVFQLMPVNWLVELNLKFLVQGGQNIGLCRNTSVSGLATPPGERICGFEFPFLEIQPTCPTSQTDVIVRQAVQGQNFHSHHWIQVAYMQNVKPAYLHHLKLCHLLPFLSSPHLPPPVWNLGFQPCKGYFFFFNEVIIEMRSKWIPLALWLETPTNPLNFLIFFSVPFSA